MLILAAAIALEVTLTEGQPVQAQFLLLEGFGQSSRVSPPSNVTRYGNLEPMVVESPMSVTDLNAQLQVQICGSSD
jgi:hypothetical protein